jgi:hypothetical protein
MTKPSSKRPSRPTGPNRLKDGNPSVAAAAFAAAPAATGSVCRFLGHDFQEGETICYRGKTWICFGGQWSKTDVAC